MSAFQKMCILCATAAAAAGFLCPGFAQDMEGQTVPDSSLRRAADIVNLMRGVFAPDPAPVLASPAERAVSVRRAGASADSNSRPSVVTTIPVVTMPDIVIPDSDASPNNVPDTAVAKTMPNDTVKKNDEQKKFSDDDDADETHPSFYYAFFFGEYVPYYNGWFYYSDRWLWGRRLPRPPEPPDWIPPPPFLPVYPGHYDFYEMIGPNGSVSISSGRPGIFSPSRMLETVRPNAPGNTIPVVPGAHRIPRRRDR